MQVEGACLAGRYQRSIALSWNGPIAVAAVAQGFAALKLNVGSPDDGRDAK